MKLFLIVLVVMVTQATSFDLKKLLLTVYYESKCSDSRKFIDEQLVPTMNQLHDYLQLKLIPFGKAQSVNQGHDGFECQHGPSECRGNMVQDCAIDLMEGRSDVDIVNYVACEMDTLAGTEGSFQCVQSARLPVMKVQECVNSRRGMDLQLHSEYLTKLVSPQFVPTVTLNGYFEQQIQDQAIEHLFAMLCTLLPEAEPCAQNYNHAAFLTKF